MDEVSQCLMKDLSSKDSMKKTFYPPLCCFNFRSGKSKQSFTSSRNQCINHIMSATTVIRQHTRSNSNVELVDHSELETIEKANRAKNSKKGKAAKRKQQAPVNLGEVAWDQMFEQGSFNLPTTSFMERLKQAVTEEDFQHIKKEILKTLKYEKDDFCTSNYSTLMDAKNKLYSMLTEILVEETGNIIDHDIWVINHERY